MSRLVFADWRHSEYCHCVETPVMSAVACLNCTSLHLQAAAEKKTSCEAFVEINNMITCELDAMTAFIKVAAGQ